MSWFASHCPRLWRAARGRRDELREERRVRHDAREKHQKLLWLVAHRELQLIRAQARGNGRYIAERMSKLERARQALVSLERTLDQPQNRRKQHGARAN